MKKKKILSLLNSINKKIEIDYEKEKNIGIIGGTAGISLFKFYFSEFLGGNADYEFAEDLLINIITSINENSYTNYCSGIAGVGWLICFIDEKKYVNLNSDKILNPLDKYLYKVMINNALNNNHDFFYGSIGYGFYFLKRLETTKNKNLKKKYTNYLFKLLKALKATTITHNNNLVWETKTDLEKDIKCINLGMPHGIISILNFLCRLYHIEALKEYCSELIINISSLIKEIFSFSKKKDLSFFPNFLIQDNLNTNNNSRLAWCYGDLSIGNTLLSVYEITKDSLIKKITFEILNKCLTRKDLDENYVIDPFICHGAFGISQIFRSIYLKTRKLKFLQASKYWTNIGIKMLEKEFESNDFKFSIIEGFSGIGLSLINYLDNLDNLSTNWDECLMIN